MTTGYFHRVANETPTRFWINNPEDSEVKKAIDAGAISCTTNPTFCEKLLRTNPKWLRSIIDANTLQHTPDDDVADQVVQHATAPLFAQFLPLYEASGGAQGFVTIQSDPRRDEDSRYMIDAALRYRALGPNFMAKIPVTSAGLLAIAALIPENIPICATEVFSLDQAIAVCELYQCVSQQCGKSPPSYVTHITGIFDEYLAKYIAEESIPISAQSLAWAGSTAARNQYRLIKERGYPVTILGGGARSTRHFSDFVGGDFHVTINWSTAEELIDWDPPVVSRIGVETPPEVVADLTETVRDFQRANTIGSIPVEEFEEFGPVRLFRGNFIAGYERLIDEIASRRQTTPGGPPNA